MKMKKFIPLLALSMLFTVPAFAVDPTPSSPTTLQSDLTFTVDNFFMIHRDTENRTSTVTIGDRYDTLAIDSPLIAHYKVYTNVGSATQKFNIKATCLTDGGAEYNAFNYNSTTGDYTIVFTNTTEGNIPTTTQVDKAKSPGDVAGADNPNAITFNFSHAVNRLANSAAGVAADTAVTPVKGADNLTYTVGNGIYDCQYTVGGSALSKTFSTADTQGTYRATIIITEGAA